MILFVKAPHLIHLLVRSWMGQLWLAGTCTCYRHASFLRGQEVVIGGLGKSRIVWQHILNAPLCVPKA